MTGDELREEYALADNWHRYDLVMKAAFQLDLLHAQVQHSENMLRMAKEVGEAWRNLYQDSWRSLMRTWVNDKDMYDEEMTKQALAEDRSNLEARHTPFTEETGDILPERQGQELV